jgi:hypothetical protein
VVVDGRKILRGALIRVSALADTCIVALGAWRKQSIHLKKYGYKVVKMLTMVSWKRGRQNFRVQTIFFFFAYF